jgi:amidohydrolase
LIDRAKQIQDQLIRWRRDIHMHPELGFQEFRTATLVADALRALGYCVQSGVGRTGVVAELGTGQPIIAIRADMDALPIQEQNDVSYASKVQGVMHACGHDAHTAIALGVARLVVNGTFPGTVRFLFQPAEETSDKKGLSGAARMIQDGAMEDVTAILALHVHASAPVGEIGLDAGPSSAGVDSFSATITGTGGHGAYPHRGVDPIHIAAHVILALNGIVSRRVDPFDPAVISLGSIHAGQASNVIPESVQLSGTIRYLTPEVQALIHSEIEQAFHVARTLGGDFSLRIRTGFPPVINDAQVVDVLREVAAELLGAENVKPREKGMGAEDFSLLAAQAPGAMFRLGCRIEGDERKAHGPHFDLDEGCLSIGVAILAESALRIAREGING